MVTPEVPQADRQPTLRSGGWLASAGRRGCYVTEGTLTGTVLPGDEFGTRQAQLVAGTGCRLPSDCTLLVDEGAGGSIVGQRGRGEDDLGRLGSGRRGLISVYGG